MIGFGMSGGKHLPSVEHIQVVALYDDSGKIVHLHTVTTLSGAVPLTEDEAISEAKVRARQRNANIEHLAIALSNNAEHVRFPHCIDPKTKAFVAISKQGKE